MHAYMNSGFRLGYKGESAEVDMKIGSGYWSEREGGGRRCVMLIRKSS